MVTATEVALSCAAQTNMRMLAMALPMLMARVATRLLAAASTRRNIAMVVLAASRVLVIRRDLECDQDASRGI